MSPYGSGAAEPVVRWAAGPAASAHAAWAALLVAGIGAATILGALFFEYALGYAPCPLCLDQRIPYYVAIPLALGLVLGARAGLPHPLLAGGLGLVAATMLIGAALGVYHSGVEWKWWAGPPSCAVTAGSFGPAGGLLQTIEATRVIPCDEAAWRFLGLSLAGYNVLVSLGLAAIAVWGAAASRDRTAA
jgi:disulfide bond formation protein DsbB